MAGLGSRARENLRATTPVGPHQRPEETLGQPRHVYPPIGICTCLICQGEKVDTRPQPLGRVCRRWNKLITFVSRGSLVQGLERSVGRLSVAKFHRSPCALMESCKKNKAGGLRGPRSRLAPRVRSGEPRVGPASTRRPGSCSARRCRLGVATAERCRLMRHVGGGAPGDVPEVTAVARVSSQETSSFMTMSLDCPWSEAVRPTL